ncbi:MAG: restriction endonuclease subunit S [Burkholderiaceae bacterium]|nr:restriction endonuclease subunit S [Burkholderiaceae bacterium]
MTAQLTLGELLIDIQAGRSFQTAEVPARPDEFGVLKVSAVTWSDFAPHEAKALKVQYEPEPHHRVRKDDLLISRANTKEFVGAVVLVDRDYPLRLLSDKTLRLVVDESRVAKEYLLFALRSPKARRHIEHFATGTSESMRNIGQGVIATIPIDLPSLPEQRIVAERLRVLFAEADAARKASLDQADDIARLRLCVLAEVFAAVAGAPTKVLGDHAPTTSGSTPARGVKEYWSPADIPWIKTGEVAFAPITQTEEAISAKALKECSLNLLPPETVLVAMYGQGKTRGQSAVLKVPATTNQACFAILPNDTWHPDYLFHWLMASYFDLRALSEGRGGNQANLNGGLLNALEIPAPSREQQVAIARRAHDALREVEALAAANTAQREELDRLPQRLLAQAFAH